MLSRIREDFKTILAVSFLTFLGGSLRLFQLGKEALWVDENFSLIFASQNLSALIHNVAIFDVHPPTYYILLKYWKLVFGSSEIALRSLSVFFGVLSIPLFYLLSRKFLGKSYALVSTTLFTLSAYLIQYSQEARMYTLFVFTALLSYYWFLEFLESNTRKNKLLYFISSLLLVYTQIMGLTVIAAQNTQYLIRFYRNRSKKEFLAWFKIQSLLALLFLPWVIVVFNQARKLSQKTQQEVPGLYEFFGSQLHLSGGWLGFILFGSLSILAILTWLWKESKSLDLNYALRKAIDQTSSSNGNLPILLIWFFVPVVLQFGGARIIPRSFDYNNLIIVLPALLLIVTFGIRSITELIGNSCSNWVCYTSIFLVITASLVGVGDFYSDRKNPEWRDAVNYFEENADDEDVVVFDSPLIQNQFSYYSQENYQKMYGYPSSSKLLGTSKSWPGISSIGNESNIWFFASHASHEKGFTNRLNKSHKTTIRDFNGLTVYHFD